MYLQNWTSHRDPAGGKLQVFHPPPMTAPTPALKIHIYKHNLPSANSYQDMKGRRSLNAAFSLEVDLPLPFNNCSLWKMTVKKKNL